MKTIMISIYQNKLKWKQFGFQFVRTNWNHQTTDQIWCCFFHIAAITLHSDQTHHQGFLASHVPWHAHVNYSPTASFGGSAPKAAEVYASYEHLLLSSRLWVLQLFETIPPLRRGGPRLFLASKDMIINVIKHMATILKSYHKLFQVATLSFLIVSCLYMLLTLIYHTFIILWSVQSSSGSFWAVPYKNFFISYGFTTSCFFWYFSSTGNGSPLADPCEGVATCIVIVGEEELCPGGMGGLAFALTPGIISLALLCFEELAVELPACSSSSVHSPAWVTLSEKFTKKSRTSFKGGSADFSESWGVKKNQ